ncbi:hypothetical protein VMCG_10420 [Cytospora schulzeri]|uniref:Uncharacterized protein n=1 Tax=Cytospora schulzeri TaxID=448051 RepID=A0A423VB78_9PEZI|nr:hypothetical protein VMCG_10420 [Valsa malicola]
MSRPVTLVILAACAAFGAYGTMGAGLRNGLFDSMTKSVGRDVEDKYFAGGPAPYKTAYTGVEAIDDHLITLVAFFIYIIDGPKTWGVVLVYWYLMAQLCAGWMLLSMEGLRQGNRGRVVSWTGTMGFILQNITYTITVPIYLIAHLLTSPISTAEVSLQNISVDTSDSATLPLSTTLSFVIPSVMMYLPAPANVSTSMHYTWQAIWQIFPVMQSIYHRILKAILPGPGPGSNSSTHLVGVYRYILFMSIVPQIILLTVAMTPPFLVPGVLKPIFEDVDLASAFVPYWPWNSPTADELADTGAALAEATVVTAEGKAELVKLFLQWDVYCGGIAILAWAAFVYSVARPDMRFLGAGGIMPKAAVWTVLGGPVGAAAMLLLERDWAVVGGFGGRKKKQ